MSEVAASATVAAPASGTRIQIEYDDRTVRWFMVASVIWSLVGLGLGLLIAAQLNFWQMNGKFIEWITFGLIQSEGIEFLTFGRLRPLHTNAAIFAFVGNMMFAGIYYSTQRLCKCRTASNVLSQVHFWGWQLIIVAAAITLPAGLTRGKEYAELIWPINIAVAAIWIVFAVNFFWTLARRNEPTIYVAIWFYIATVITVAMLYVVNHLSIPTGLLHSYPIFSGVKDALVQWWYGHNAVAFFLTTPILGIMYYFLPKAAERPVYSYRLSVIHFWSLVFIYIWAGPHHLLNTALPSWLQALGMTFSLMLWAPSWGGMLNGLLTLRGAWDKLRTDPVIKFFAAGVTFYGMATFEGPLLSIKAVNSLSHYSDWTIGHVHGGTLGWNGFMAAGMFYWLAPRLWNTQLFSKSLANLHFWIGMVGILLYVAAMWTSGITQGAMLNNVDEASGILANPAFIETVNAIKPAMLFRAIGGLLYFIGFLLMTYNLGRTILQGKAANGVIETARWDPYAERGLTFTQTIFNAPVLYITAIILVSCGWLFGTGGVQLFSLLLTMVLVLLMIVHFNMSGAKWGDWYQKLLANSLGFTVLTFVSVAIGGAVQIIPTVVQNEGEALAANAEAKRIQILRTPLEQAGFEIYVSEGCNTCHSQNIRTLASDVMRYDPKGGASYLGESIFDRPFVWGSKRTGPDLSREGVSLTMRKSNTWHYQHMVNPRALEEASIMPNYHFLNDYKVDFEKLASRLLVLRDNPLLGDPFPQDWDAAKIEELARAQGLEIAESLARDAILVDPESEMVALIAYLQSLGKYAEIPVGGQVEVARERTSR
ncbi:MAG: cytochrome-c oxidase, cbb3-type subunit I [Opitutales bacterium]